jgi:hypothetical protein
MNTDLSSAFIRENPRFFYVVRSMIVAIPCPTPMHMVHSA